MSASQNPRQAPDIKRSLLRLMARSYALGPSPDKGALVQYRDGTPIDPEWPLNDIDVWGPADWYAAACYAATMFMQLAFEVDAAQAEGREPSVKAVLDRLDLALTLHEGGPAALLARLIELGYLPAAHPVATPRTGPTGHRPTRS